MRNPSRKPNSHCRRRFHGTLEAVGGVLRLCLLLVALPFLALFGPGDSALPEASEAAASAGSGETSPDSPDDRPADRSPDECQSVPGGNPAGPAAAPALHPRAAARKGGAFARKGGAIARKGDLFAGASGGPADAESLSRAARFPFRIPGGPATSRPPLAFFPGYPVFLLAALPPPSA